LWFMEVNGYKIEPNAELPNAELTGTYLSLVNLTKANLTGADLRFVNLTNTNLTGATMPDGSIHD